MLPGLSRTSPRILIDEKEAMFPRHQNFPPPTPEFHPVRSPDWVIEWDRDIVTFGLPRLEAVDFMQKHAKEWGNRAVADSVQKWCTSAELVRGSLILHEGIHLIFFQEGPQPATPVRAGRPFAGPHNLRPRLRAFPHISPLGSPATPTVAHRPATISRRRRPVHHVTSASAPVHHHTPRPMVQRRESLSTVALPPLVLSPFRRHTRGVKTISETRQMRSARKITPKRLFLTVPM